MIFTVTGATSMIGVALIKEAIKNEVSVIAIVREHSGKIDRLPKSNFVRIVECNLEDLSELSINAKSDVFYHFGWSYTDKTGRKNAYLQEKNVKTTCDAVELAKRMGCRRFIGAGSQAEYGKTDGKISPETVAKPDVPYGIAKLKAGQLAQSLCGRYGMEYVWGRIFSVYGTLDNDGTMINYAMDKFLKNERAEFSAATQMWNYLNEKDAGTAFYLLGIMPNIHGIYCIANEESKPLKEYIEEIRKIFDGETECIYAAENPKEKLAGIDANISKLVEDTGFHPNVCFRDGIREIIRYKKQQ